MRKHITEIVMAALLFCLTVLPVYWWWEAYPYRYILVESSRKIQPREGPIRMDVSLFRERACPFVVERRVTDSKNRRINQDRSVRPTPTVTGKDVEFPLIITIESPPAARGVGLYETRIGTMCNPLRKIFPLWSEWIAVRFTLD